VSLDDFAYLGTYKGDCQKIYLEGAQKVYVFLKQLNRKRQPFSYKCGSSTFLILILLLLVDFNLRWRKEGPSKYIEIRKNRALRLTLSIIIGLTRKKEWLARAKKTI
jgi:hypothetical protein